jgi:ComF family protein
MWKLLKGWPSVCEVCARWPSAPLCPACRQAHARLRPRCPGCALPLAPGLSRCVRCHESPPTALARCDARVGYGYPWTDLVARFKFQDEPAWGRLLASLMAESPATRDILQQATLLAPVALSPQRLRGRGYNQAWEMLRHLQGLAPQASARPDLLLRRDDDAPLHTLPRAERQQRAAQVFCLNPAASADLAGADVVLVDDVMTTGATLQAAAQVLQAAGARRVSAVVFARTPAPGSLE